MCYFILCLVPLTLTLCSEELCLFIPPISRVSHVPGPHSLFSLQAFLMHPSYFSYPPWFLVSEINSLPRIVLPTKISISKWLKKSLYIISRTLLLGLQSSSYVENCHVAHQKSTPLFLCVQLFPMNFNSQAHVMGSLFSPLQFGKHVL